MGRYALINTATGDVVNVILWDGVSEYAVPDGLEVIEAGPNAEPGGTWDGSSFVRMIMPSPDRITVLMHDGVVEKTAEENAELLDLLHSKLASTGDLSWEEMNKMLALERES